LLLILRFMAGVIGYGNVAQYIFYDYLYLEEQEVVVFLKNDKIRGYSSLTNSLKENTS
jgi:hypothetical protein